MTLFDILSFSSDMLHRLSAMGIKRTDDYRLADLYRDYLRMKTRGEKTTYAVALLAERYAMSERRVYKVLRLLKGECSGGAVE